MKKVSAVTFDLWDTLIREHPGGSDKVARLRIERIGKLLGERGMLHSEDEIEAAYEETGDFLNLTWSKKRDMSVRDQVLFMLSSIDGKLAGRLTKADLGQIERIYSEGILEHPPGLLPGAREALEDVEGGGYKIGLISNTGRTPGSVLRVVMDRMGILDRFDVTVFSNEILVRKPAEKAFRTALDKLKVVPRSAVHVGDDPDKDVLGAKRCGMKSIQVVSEGDTSSEMADAHIPDLSRLAAEIQKL